MFLSLYHPFRVIRYITRAYFGITFTVIAVAVVLAIAIATATMVIVAFIYKRFVPLRSLVSHCLLSYICV